MRDYPEAGLGISAVMTRDYNPAVLSARRLGLCSSAAGKLASDLLDWVRMDHLDDSYTHTALPISFQMPLTHEELDSMAGIARETNSRLLTKFRREGLVDQINEKILCIVLINSEGSTARVDHRYCMEPCSGCNGSKFR